MQRLLLLLALLLGLSGAAVYFWPMADGGSTEEANGDDPSAEEQEQVAGLKAPTSEDVIRSERPPPPPELEYPLAQGSKQPVVMGRLLNEEGVVGKNLKINALVRVQEEGFDDTVLHGLRTDDYGRFQLYLGKRFRAGRTRTVTFEIGATKRKPRRTAVYDFSHPMPPGIHDLGDVILTQPPVILQGQVVDPFGVGIEGATIRLERFNSSSESLNQFAVVEPYWQSLRGWTTHTDAQGHFSVHGDPEVGNYRVSVSHYQHEDVKREIVLHEPYLVIKLRRNFNLDGKLLLDADVETGSIRILLGREARGEDPDNLAYEELPDGLEYVDSINIYEDGGFSFHGIAEEKLTILVQCVTLHETLFMLKDVVMRPRNDLMILPPIDMRGKLRSAKLKVVSHDGKLLTDYQIATDLDGPWSNPYANIISVATTDSPLNLYLRARGYRSVALEGIRGKKKVILDDGIPIKLRLDGPEQVPQPLKIRGSFFQARDGGSDGPWDNQPLLDTVLTPGRVQKVILPAPGTYLVELQLGRYARTHVMIIEDLNEAPKIFVQDIDEPQEFSIFLPPALLADAVRREQVQFLEDAAAKNGEQ